MNRLPSIVISSAVIAGLFAWCSTASGSVVAYWDMDAATVSGKLPANSGSQAATVTASFVDLGVGFSTEIVPDVSGTNLNRVGADPGVNRAVGFYRVGTIYTDGAFLMEGFDFTGLTGAGVSFAYRSGSSFTWDVNLDVDYRISNGAWVDIAEGLVWQTDWTVASVGFASALDGAGDVDLRIRTISWVSGFSYLDIDNVQVTAIPEVGGGLAMLAACGAAVSASLRRLRHRAPLSNARV